MYRSFYRRLNQEYLIPLLTHVRTQFPYWNRTSGSNHLIAFTLGKNMGVVQNNVILDSLKNVIQLGLTGFRQDLLSLHSPRQFIHRNATPVYRHHYDIVIPPFDRLQLIHNHMRTNSTGLYQMKKCLLFFTEQIGNGKQLNTITLIDDFTPPIEYSEFIRSTMFHLCPEGFSPWSPRLYESIGLGAIPLILTDSIVLPFERFIDWRSFSTKINVTQAENILDLVKKIDRFEDFTKRKLNHAGLYFNAFRWPYSPIDNRYDRHQFLPEEDLNGTVKNVFHYLFLELRYRRLEQFYGLTLNTFSIDSIAARRQVCTHHATMCPCHDEQQRL